jgi:hypothetical protein
MGNSPLIGLAADQESPTEPGKLSVVTEEIKTEYDAFFDEVLEVVKYPVGPNIEAVVKEVKISDTGPGEFSVMLVLDGQKLTSYGYGHKEKPDMDFVAQYVKFQCDKAGRKIVSLSHGPSAGFFMEDLEKYEGKPQLKATVLFLEGPFRVEYWWDTTDTPHEGLSPNTRYSGEYVKGVVSPIIQAVATKFATLKVTTLPDQASPGGGGEKSVVSNSLGEDEVTFATLMDGLVGVIRENAAAGTVVADVSDTQFTVAGKLPDGTETLRTVTHNKEKGTVVSEMKIAGSLNVTDYYVLHKSPLQFEAWNVDKEGRKSGKAMARECQKNWNAAYAKATSANSWFSW